jgi:CheY-like chemotaxis protein
MKHDTILVVEDSKEDLELLRWMFRKSKILNEVQAMESGDDAIAYLKGEGRYANREAYPYPILILLDVHLRGASGWDVLSWIGRNRPASALGVVVLTGSDLGSINRAYYNGADSFLTKPLSFEEFQTTVGRLRGVKLETTEQGVYLTFA